MRCCGSCKHWDRAIMGTSWCSVPVGPVVGLTYAQIENKAAEVGKRYGLCRGIPQCPESTAQDLIAFTQDASMYQANLITRDDFGCVCHEPKEMAE